MKRSLTSFTCEFLIGIFLGIRATELDRRRRRRRRANGRGEMESRRGEIGGSQCMFTLSGVFAKSCFIDGGLEGSSRTLDTAEEAEAKNQACVLHYKFSPPSNTRPHTVYYSLHALLQTRYNNNNNNLYSLLEFQFLERRKTKLSSWCLSLQRDQEEKL